MTYVATNYYKYSVKCGELIIFLGWMTTVVTPTGIGGFTKQWSTAEKLKTFCGGCLIRVFCTVQEGHWQTLSDTEHMHFAQ